MARRLLDGRLRRGPAILLYHRVARLDHDPWGLAITPELFHDQVAALARRRTVVPLERLADGLERGRTPSDWVVITFDDGYADVLHAACPILETFGCPATLFVTTGTLGADAFWWDRLIDAIFIPAALPDRLSLKVHGREFTWTAETQGADRNRLHPAVWRWLRSLSGECREEALRLIEDWAGRPNPRDGRDRPLTAAELRELADGGVFSIGAHSVSHAPLPELTRAEKTAEIAGSRRACEEILGRPVSTFAYPFGELDGECQEEARGAGFRLACSTVPGPARVTAPRFALPRIAVGPWSGAELVERLPWGS